MQNKLWTKYLVSSISIILTFIAIVNYTINPYNIFSHSYQGHYNFFKPHALSDRMSKFYEAKHLNASTIMMGTSRIGFFKYTYLEPYAPRPIYNFAMAGGSIYEQTRYLEYIIKHTDVKTIVWAIDFFPFNPDKENETTFKDERLDQPVYINDYVVSLLNYRTFEKSIQTVKTNFKHDYSKELNRPYFEEAQYLPMQGQPYNQNEIKKHVCDTLNEYKNRTVFFKSTHFTNPHSIDPGIARLKYIIQLCKEKNIKCVFYTSPVYAAHIDLIYAIGLGNTFEYWKESLAKIQPYYDFSTYNSVTNNIMNFRDSAHIVSSNGKLIFAKIFQDHNTSVPEDFGTYVSTANEHKHLLFQKEQVHPLLSCVKIQ
jgi:hypothetical protein